MKKSLFVIAVCLISLGSLAQNKYSENDIKQFYRTIQGNYTAQINDTLAMSLRFTPIWEYEPFKWLYMEAVDNGTKAVIEQKVIEIRPVSDISFYVVVHNLDHPEQFAGKWDSHNYFDGFNTRILSGSSKFHFMKTMDYEYQTSWNSRKNLKCFPSGDKLHFKFVQEDERLYVKRLPQGTTDLIGITFHKEPTD